MRNEGGSDGEEYEMVESKLGAGRDNSREIWMSCLMVLIYADA
jgi:hypothetical protein